MSRSIENIAKLSITQEGNIAELRTNLLLIINDQSKKEGCLVSVRATTCTKTIKPMVVLLGTNEPETSNQAQEQIRQGN
jgi:hypothetical protein